ncbi:MAG: NADH-quinone oxidoreductase subunit NuoF [Chitinivibrionales bacterium]|nr:NADH-quinone oxidoreductase subunit NuoF [Chitinivibrionales bacterium]
MKNSVPKIATRADLDRVRDAARSAPDKDVREKILVCTGGGCMAAGAKAIKTALTGELKKQGLEKEVALVETGCLGPCVVGPVLVMSKERVFYQGVAPADAAEIVQEHIVKGRIIERLAWKEGPHKTPLPLQAEIPFFKRQTKIVLRNCGVIDPNSIDDYIGHDGYQAVAQALFSMTPETVIEEMKKSGLRGRGGAGFPTHLKWAMARKSPGEVKYILCNADEGDPGAFMDRSVLEGDPHAVIEGMLIGGYAIGAHQGYVYVRAEYPLAVERLQRAIEAASERGLLGENILGSGFNFALEIRKGSGAFVCGEETALMASIEGNRGEPRPRPPYPALKGLWRRPTVLNNVETFANVPFIIARGGAAYSALGTERSKGSKVFALAGAITISGLVEVPVGTPLEDLIYEIGGGIKGGRNFKAAQIGGPSGGCIPREHIAVPLDYESLNALGAIMGSGGLVVMDESACMVDVARFFMEFVQEESCGKCVPCREGTKRMLDILNKICAGDGCPEDLALLQELGGQIKAASLCGLGQTAPNPVLSTMRHFRDEYEAHIVHKRCPAGVCAALLVYSITDACTGCGACKRACPSAAIAGSAKVKHIIDPALCIRCGACFKACKFGAVLKA